MASIKYGALTRRTQGRNRKSCSALTGGKEPLLGEFWFTQTRIIRKTAFKEREETMPLNFRTETLYPGGGRVVGRNVKPKEKIHTYAYTQAHIKFIFFFF